LCPSAWAWAWARDGIYPWRLLSMELVSIEMEAAAGIEPAYKVLQTSA